MNFFKRHIRAAVVVIILIAIIGGYFYFKSGKKISPEFVIAQKGDIMQEVSVTGNVKAVKSVDLAFEKAGKISAVLADVSQYVSNGAVLVREDSSELQSQLDKANADLATQNADLAKEKIVLSNEYSSVSDILNDNYTKADDAARNQTDAMFTSAETDNPQLTFTSSDSQAATDARNGRLASRAELINWKQEINNLDTMSQDALYSELVKSQSHLSIIRTFLVRLMDALNQAYGLSSSTLTTYKTAIITARDEVNTAATNMTNQIQAIDSQKATVASDEASIQSYQAIIQNIKNQIAKTSIYAPINGIVTKQDAKVGEIAAANAVLISVMSGTNEMEAYIPEVDIAKVKIGDSATVTLDAYGRDVVFDAKVTAIDPAETMIEGVATYKTTLQFVSTNNKPVKSGMTANIDISTAAKSNVLIVPQRTVVSKNSDNFVDVYNSSDGSVNEIKVTIGLRGSDGNIEILDGLKEGDKVIIPVTQ